MFIWSWWDAALELMRSVDGMLHRRYTGFLFNQADDKGNGSDSDAGGDGANGKTGNSDGEG